ncbi:hypothetical protein LRP88_02264 [Fusarium phalaenopsidis]
MVFNVWFGLSCLVAGSLLAWTPETWTPDWFGGKPAAPPQEFLAKVCPMQWDIYDESKQHLTLYHFLGLKTNAKKDEIWNAYQRATKTFGAKADACLGSIFSEDGERITDGIPLSCQTDEYYLADKMMRLATGATLVLLDEGQEQTLYDIHFLTVMYEAENMGDKVADKSNLQKWKRNMGKMMRLQSEIRESMCSLCGAYAREGHCREKSGWIWG